MAVKPWRGWFLQSLMMTLNTGVLTLKMSPLDESTQWVHTMSPLNEGRKITLSFIYKSDPNSLWPFTVFIQIEIGG